MRRGVYNRLDKAKLLSGEFAVVMSGDPSTSDGAALYICFSSTGTIVKRVATWEDMATIISQVIGDSLDVAIESGDNALLVERTEDEDESSVYVIRHKAPFVNGHPGLDPAALTAGNRTTLGTTNLTYGDGFWIPCVTTDPNGHATTIAYRRLVLPNTFATATADKAGAVWPDGTTILLQENGVISVPEATDETAGLLTPEWFAALSDEVEHGPVVVDAYEVGETEYAYDWLSDEDDGEPIEPLDGRLYVIVSGGHQNEVFRWNGTAYAPVSAVIDVATTTTAGKVKPDGTTITVDQDGTIHGANTYTLPTMSTTVKGGAMVGDGLTMDEDALEVDTQVIATQSDLGDVRDALGELAGDVSDLAEEMPENVSDLTNDVGYLDADGPFDATKLTGTVPATNLPSYVDDVVEGYLYQGAFYVESSHETAIVGETGKIYVDLTDDSTYRWSGSAYISISNPIDFATQSEAEAGSDNTKAMTPLRTKQAIDANAYTLPTMSASTKGGATVGTGLAMDGDSLAVDVTEIATREYASTVAETTRTSDGSTAGPISSLSAEGWAEQDTTTGKNLLPNTATSQTINGVTFTVNADGSITAKGAASSRADLFLINYGDERPISSGTYTLSSGGNYYLEMVLIDTGGGSAMYANTLDGNKTFTIDGDKIYRAYLSVTSGVTIDATIYPQLELGSTATDYEPYTGGAPSPSPSYAQEIRVARGRNLLDTSGMSSPYLQRNEDGSFTVSAQPSTAQYIVIGSVGLVGGATYTLSGGVSKSTYVTIGSFGASNPTPLTFTATTTQANQVAIVMQPTTPLGTTFYPQLERGSVAAPYVPYGHVGMDVYDGSTHVKTIPIPLPSKGFAASLPDGTCDTLTLDGAGGYVWESRTAEVTFDDSVDEKWSANDAGSNPTMKRMITTSIASAVVKPSSNNDSVGLWCSQFVEVSANSAINKNQCIGVPTSGNVTMYTTDYQTVEDWKMHLASVPMTVLYPLATPTTESGYVEGWTNNFPQGCVLSIPELDDLSVKYFTDEAASTLAHQWYERAKSEYADRIEALESAVAELIAGS